VPGGLATAAILVAGASSGGGATKCAPVPGRPEDCSFTTSSDLGPLGVAALVVGLAAPLATSVYLARRARLRPAA